MQKDKQHWYKDGLRFECQRCGNCCRGEPGVVWVNKKEIEEISSFMGINQNAFAKNHLRAINGRYSLREYKNGDCILYENGCKVYEARPSQCRTFPFWKSNLENSNEWEDIKKTGPGIDKGKLHTLEEINSYLEIDSY